MFLKQLYASFNYSNLFSKGTSQCRQQIAKYHCLIKYEEGYFIVHTQKDSEYLNVSPATVADGTYIIVNEL